MVASSSRLPPLSPPLRGVFPAVGRCKQCGVKLCFWASKTKTGVSRDELFEFVTEVLQGPCHGNQQFLAAHTPLGDVARRLLLPARDVERALTRTPALRVALATVQARWNDRRAVFVVWIACHAPARVGRAWAAGVKRSVCLVCSFVLFCGVLLSRRRACARRSRR